LRRSFLLPLHLLREYRVAKFLRPDLRLSEFDRAHGVDTDGRFGGWTDLSDLDIHSANWMDGQDYLPIEPDRFKRVLVITRYFSPTQKGRKIQSQNVDFTNFTLPPEASVLFFFDPFL
jgi:hypothetical protein